MNETEASRLDSHDFAYHNGPYTYIDTYVGDEQFAGDFSWFQGFEEIYCNNVKVYECYFHGGTLN